MIVSDVLSRIMPRVVTLKATSGITFIDAFNRVVDVFFDRLHRLKSEMAWQQFEDMTVDEEFVYMPDDFRGFASPLMLENSNGDRVELLELPYGYSETEGTEPEYYRLVGPYKVQFTPRPTDTTYSEAFTLYGFYYAHPGEFELTDVMPWEGLYNKEIEDAVVMVISIPGLDLMSATVAEAIESIMDKKTINRIVTPRTNKLW